MIELLFMIEVLCMIKVLCMIGEPHACMAAAAADRAERLGPSGAREPKARGNPAGHSPRGLGSGDPRAYPYEL